MRVEEDPARGSLGELASQSPHVNVYRAIAGSERPLPGLSRQRVAADHRARPSGEGDEQCELIRGQAERAPVHDGDVVGRLDVQRPSSQALSE